MVKNESQIIKRCLSSIKDIIDYYVIVDTGSSDNTIDIIKEYLKDIPGEIHSKPWINFAYNRTDALQLAKNKSDYAILLDADMMVLNVLFDKNKLESDAYHIRYAGNCDYAQVLLINNRLDWKYKGVTHEYITSEQAKSFETLEELKILHLHDGSSRETKFQRDIELLEQGIKDEPENSRYYFYLAQSYKDLGNYEKASDYYLKRAKMYGWEEEVFYSIYQLGYCNEMLGKVKEAKYYYLAAWEFRPTRAEPLYRLSVLCNKRKEHEQAYVFAKSGLKIKYPKDLLFIDKSAYTNLSLEINYAEKELKKIKRIR